MRLSRSCKLSVMTLAAFLAGGIPLAQAQQGRLKSETIDNTRDVRFCEIVVVKLSGIAVYNTIGVGDCPAESWDGLNVKKVRSQLDALRVEKNGPYFWMMDSQTVQFGTKASFWGIETRWVGRLPLRTGPLAASTGSKPYTVLTPKKTQRIVYSKGKPVYELVDPHGNIYVLQAHAEMFPIDTLANLGEQLKLPQGWQFRTQDLSEDLVLDFKSNQTIYAIADEFHQYWTRIPKYQQLN